MESNLLIYLATIIVALATLPILVPLITGGVGLCKPGCNLRGGVGSHQHQGQDDQVHCGERLRSLLQSSSIPSWLLSVSVFLLSRLMFLFFYQREFLCSFTWLNWKPRRCNISLSSLSVGFPAGRPCLLSFTPYYCCCRDTERWVVPWVWLLSWDGGDWSLTICIVRLGSPQEGRSSPDSLQSSSLATSNTTFLQIA